MLGTPVPAQFNYYSVHILAMQIHVLGGFLGSGKTTLLMRIANTYIRAGKKVAVLVNVVIVVIVDGSVHKTRNVAHVFGAIVDLLLRVIPR